MFLNSKVVEIGIHANNSRIKYNGSTLRVRVPPLLQNIKNMSDLVLGLDTGILTPNDLADLLIDYDQKYNNIGSPNLENAILIGAKWNGVNLTKEELDCINKEHNNWVIEQAIMDFYPY